MKLRGGAEQEAPSSFGTLTPECKEKKSEIIELHRAPLDYGSLPFTTRRGYGGRILDLNPRRPHGGTLLTKREIKVIMILISSIWCDIKTSVPLIILSTCLSVNLSACGCV